MNNTKHCFDGGDCTSQYAEDYREPCKDYECCSKAGPPTPAEDNCGTVKPLFLDMKFCDKI